MSETKQEQHPPKPVEEEKQKAPNQEKSTAASPINEKKICRGLRLRAIPHIGRHGTLL